MSDAITSLIGLLVATVRSSWYWFSGIGPWYVVGTYTDDEGNLRRFRTGLSTKLVGDELILQFRHYDKLSEACEYARERNMEAATDPLGASYHVWHRTEYNTFVRGRKKA